MKKVRWLFLHNKRCYLLKNVPLKLWRTLFGVIKKKKTFFNKIIYLSEEKLTYFFHFLPHLLVIILFTLSRFITFAFRSIPTIPTISISSLCKGFSSCHESFTMASPFFLDFFVFFLTGINWKIYCSRQIFRGCSSRVLECLRIFVYYSYIWRITWLDITFLNHTSLSNFLGMASLFMSIENCCEWVWSNLVFPLSRAFFWLTWFHDVS